MAWEINLIGVARERERAEAGDSGAERGEGSREDRGRETASPMVLHSWKSNRHFKSPRYLSITRA